MCTHCVHGWNKEKADCLENRRIVAEYTGIRGVFARERQAFRIAKDRNSVTRDYSGSFLITRNHGAGTPTITNLI